MALHATRRGVTFGNRQAQAGIRRSHLTAHPYRLPTGVQLPLALGSYRINKVSAKLPAGLPPTVSPSVLENAAGVQPAHWTLAAGGRAPQPCSASSSPWTTTKNPRACSRTCLCQTYGPLPESNETLQTRDVGRKSSIVAVSTDPDPRGRGGEGCTSPGSGLTRSGDSWNPQTNPQTNPPWVWSEDLVTSVCHQSSLRQPRRGILEGSSWVRTGQQDGEPQPWAELTDRADRHLRARR